MIKVGDRLPVMKLMTATADGPAEVSTEALFRDVKAVLFGVPGAFTPTCSAQHMPGFLEQADALAAKGVARIVCMAVNDVFVLGAWGREQKIGDRVSLLADGSAQFTRALGLEMDLSSRGLGVRCQRFALVADNMLVTHLALEPPGGFEVSRAEEILKVL